MALFGKKKETKKESAPKGKIKSAVAPKSPATGHNLGAVIVRPRVTEKAVGMSEKNVYTFVVRRDATKFQVRDAVKALYNVTPVKVNIVNKAPARRKKGMSNQVVKESGIKKAYVYLKEGDSINLV